MTCKDCGGLGSTKLLEQIDALSASIDATLAERDALIIERDAAVRRLDALTLPGQSVEGVPRRERIAKDVLAGFPLRMIHGAFPSENREWTHAEYARHALARADALIAALDGKAGT